MSVHVAEVYLDDLLLARRSFLQGLHHQPATLVILHANTQDMAQHKSQHMDALYALTTLSESRPFAGKLSPLQAHFHPCILARQHFVLPEQKQ